MKKVEPRAFRLPEWPPTAVVTPNCGMHDCIDEGHEASDHSIVRAPGNPYLVFIVCKKGCQGHEAMRLYGRIPCASMFNTALVSLN